MKPTLIRSRLFVGVFCILFLSFFGGCAESGIYQVRVTPVEKCDILPTTEACDEAVGIIDERAVLSHTENAAHLFFLDEEWISTTLEGKRVIRKETSTTTEPGPCTVTISKKIEYEETEDSTLKGNYETSSITDGAESCGDTPNGKRETFTFTGELTDSI